jgi:hypothetical protein
VKRLVVVAILVACKDGGDGGRPKVAIPDDHAAAVNDRVPATWRDKLRFEIGTLVEGDQTYKLARPTGWEPGPLPGSIQAPGQGKRFATMRVGSNCDGKCEAKDWPSVVERLYYAKFSQPGITGQAITDLRQPDRRTLVFVREKTEQREGDAVFVVGERGVNILTTWWRPGGSEHYICEVELVEEAIDLARAFERACAVVSAE